MDAAGWGGNGRRAVALGSDQGVCAMSGALSRGRRAKSDRIDTEFIARIMAFRPEAGGDCQARRSTFSQP